MAGSCEFRPVPKLVQGYCTFLKGYRGTSVDAPLHFRTLELVGSLDEFESSVRSSRPSENGHTDGKDQDDRGSKRRRVEQFSDDEQLRLVRRARQCLSEAGWCEKGFSAPFVSRRRLEAADRLSQALADTQLDADGLGVHTLRHLAVRCIANHLDSIGKLHYLHLEKKKLQIETERAYSWTHRGAFRRRMPGP